MVSNNGYDYTEMANYFNAKYYFEDNILFNRMQLKKEDFDKACLEYNQDTLTDIYKTTWLDNLIIKFKYICNQLSGDYIIYLEDDVKINGRITTDIHYDLNGFCPNKLGWNQQIELFNTLKIQYRRLNLDNMQYTGHGGSIYKKEFLKQTIENKELIEDMRENFHKYHLDCNLTYTEPCQDYCISFLFFLNGGTIGPLSGHIDCSSDNTTATIQHQYKKYYNAERSYPDLLHTIKNLYCVPPE
tara:strand:+ start:4714 stop:5442 length:729 start_codon:yes stop_codon:yes gene_type:complete